MPLPSLLNGAKQCQVMTKRTKLRCKNLAAYGCKACRMHGAHKSKNVLRGKKHPQYKNGQETLEAKAELSKKSADLRYLIDIGNYCGLYYKKLRPAGRPPSNYFAMNLDGDEEMLIAMMKVLEK